MLDVATATDRFREATYHAAGEDFDDADAILVECVISDPGNAEFVEAFLANLTRKHGPPPSVVKAKPLPASLQKSQAAQNWQEFLSAAPRFLSVDLWQPALLVATAEACDAIGRSAAAVSYLKRASEAQPSDVTIARRYAQSLTKLRKLGQALPAWRKVEVLVPGDAEAAKMLASITIERSRRLGGLKAERFDLGDELIQNNAIALTSANSAPAKLAQPAAETQAGGVRLTPIQVLESAIRKAPGIPDYYLQLAPLYMEKGRDYDAEKLLAKGRDETDDDPQLRTMWEEIFMQRLGKRITAAETRVAAENTDATRHALEELLGERDEMEMDIFVNRCKREPQNLMMQYELGRRLKRIGKTKDAIAHFTAALDDAVSRPLAAYELGETAQQAGELAKALQHFRTSADAAVRPDQVECRKQALYRAAGIAAKIKLYKLADRYVTELLELDPNYKEAAALKHTMRRWA